MYSSAEKGWSYCCPHWPTGCCSSTAKAKFICWSYQAMVMGCWRYIACACWYQTDF